MFNDVGEKIKKIAHVIFWIASGAYVLSGLFFFISGATAPSDNALLFHMIGGICIILIGPLSAWISCCFIYGFGELISNTDSIKKSSRNIERRV